MEKVRARRLLDFPAKRLRDELRTNCIIQFDDNVERELSYREIIVNRYIWEVLKLYKDVPLLSAFDITNNYVAGSYVSTTFNKTYEVIIDYLITNVFEPNHGLSNMSDVWRTITDTFNNIYNDIIFNNLNYITNLDIKEFLDIVTDPRLIKSMRDVKNADVNDGIATSAAVHETYKVLDTIMRDGSFPNNKLVNGYLSKTMKTASLQQILASRGKITTLSGEVYKHPIASSFTIGMYGMDELLMESQTGAKSLKTTASNISESEYLARKMQIGAGNVQAAIVGDCKQPRYIDWYVAPESNIAGEYRKSHLPALVGKLYYNEETGQEEYITNKHTHLEGKTIKLRTAYGCRCFDKRCICSKCLGKMAYSLPAHTHLGHFACTSFSQKVTQGMLSTKHNTGSADGSPIHINNASRFDFEPKANSSTLVCLKKKYIPRPDEDSGVEAFDNKKDFELHIKVATDAFRGLADITPNTDIKRFSPFAVSDLHSLFLVKTNKATGEVLEIPVEIKKSKKFGSFTTEFLLHVQKVQFSIDADDYVVIPLEDWDFNLPIIVIPDVEFNYAAFLANVSRLFGSAVISGTSVGRKKAEVDSEDDDIFSIVTQDGFLYRLFTEVSTKLDVNIALLEVIVAAFSMENYQAGEYGVAHGAPTASTRNIKTTIFNRSCGGIYAYQEHLDSMLNPKTFDLNNRVNHIMDVFLMPTETVAEYKANPLPAPGKVYN